MTPAQQYAGDRKGTSEIAVIQSYHGGLLGEEYHATISGYSSKPETGPSVVKRFGLPGFTDYPREIQLNPGVYSLEMYCFIPPSSSHGRQRGQPPGVGITPRRASRARPLFQLASKDFSMNRFRSLVAATAVASLAACSTVLPTAHSGFLSDYTALTRGPDAAAASRASADRIDPARVTVDAVAWRVAGSADISTEERETLLALLRNELQQRVQALPAQPLGRPAVLRAAITRVETVSPLLNTLSSLVLTIPLERGGAAMEIEAVDPQTGRQLAALTPGWRAPVTELMVRFSKLAAAETAVRKAAADFVLLLQAAPDAGKQTALR